ncbi:DnaJ C-terminal domain-containing protein [Paracoccus amoyensis]|uniref:DnaJ C-terminal domain-containing protein n=1 Tax=Paracoccus amoyensis TaxID=2760093 RepID=UPI0031B57376
MFLTLPVTIYEAALGGKVPVPTIDGSVNLSIPAGSNTGRKLRLKGRGINGGDQTVELKVVMPPKVDSELTEFMEKWSKDHQYDPRSELKAGV